MKGGVESRSARHLVNMKNVLKEFDLSGKVAIVTGSSAGMGQAAAVALAQAGCDIYAVDINIPSEQTRELVEQEGVRYVECKYDVAKQMMEAEALVANAVKEYGHVDYLLNVAGVAPPTNKIQDFDFQNDYLRIMDLNINGQTALAAAFAKQLIKQNTGGRIINWSSISAHVCFGEGVGLGYSIAKSGILGLTKSLAVALRPYDVTVNCITPGEILTDFAITGGYGADSVTISKAMGMDIEKMGKAEDIMGMVLVLCSEAGRRFNGAEFVFDGGRLVSA